MTRARPVVLLALLSLSLVCGRAAAEVSEVRLPQQTSMGYMQFSIMDRYKLIEKYSKAAGLGDVKVFWDTFNGPNNMNDALLAGRVDFVSGGVPGLVTLWEKTAGSPQEVRGVSAMARSRFSEHARPQYQNHSRSLGQGQNRGARGESIGAGGHAAMAAAKESARRISPGSTSSRFRSRRRMRRRRCCPARAKLTTRVQRAAIPVSQLEKTGVRTMLNSFDVMGGPHTSPLSGRAGNSATRTRSFTARSLRRCRKRPTSEQGSPRSRADLGRIDEKQLTGDWLYDKSWRTAGAIHAGAAKHDEVRGLHDEGGLDEEEARVVEGSLLPRNSQRLRQLIRVCHDECTPPGCRRSAAASRRNRRRARHYHRGRRHGALPRRLARPL